jgi:protease secretion system outer membrane protein
MIMRSTRLRSLLATASVVLLNAPTQILAADLLEAYQLAISADPDFQAAKAAARAGQELVPLARSQLLPTVGVSAGYFKNQLDTKTDLTRRFDDYPSKSASVSLRQPIFRPAAYASLRQASAQSKGARAVFNKAQNDVAIRVSNAYFLIALADDQLASFLSQQAYAAAQVRAAQAAMRAGQGTRIDVDDTQARFDLIAARVLGAREQAAEARNALEALINVDVSEVRPIDPQRLQLQPVGPQDLTDWIAEAEAQSPDLEALKSQVLAARWEVKRSASTFLPTADLVIQKSLSESDNIVNPNARYVNGQIGVQLSMPIYTGGYNSAKVRQSRASLRELEARYEGARRKLTLQVEREFNAIGQAILKVDALDQASRSAEQALISNQKGFVAGTRSQLDILDAEEKRANVRLELTRERVGYIMARMRLLALAGQLGEEEISRVNAWL